MKLTGAMEVMEVFTSANGSVVEQTFLYEGIQTLGQAREIVQCEHIDFLNHMTRAGNIICFSVIPHLIREGESA